jgi:hypothetical protein
VLAWEVISLRLITSAQVKTKEQIQTWMDRMDRIKAYRI